MIVLRQIVYALFLLSIFHSGVTYADNYKFGVIDFERLYSQTPQGKEVLKVLHGEFAAERSEIRSLEHDITSKKAEYTLIKDALEPIELKKINEEYRVLMAEHKESKANYEARFGLRLQEERQKLYAIYGTVIEKFAEEGGYDALMDRNAVPFLKGHMDVTAKILSELEKLHKKILTNDRD